MNVMRVEARDGKTGYELRGLTEDEATMLGALADFPVWGKQPPKVRDFCAALHSAFAEAMPWGTALNADVHDMTPNTTVTLN